MPHFLHVKVGELPTELLYNTLMKTIMPSNGHSTPIRSGTRFVSPARATTGEQSWQSSLVTIFSRPIFRRQGELLVQPPGRITAMYKPLG